MNSPGPLPPVPDDAPEHRVTVFAWWHVAVCVVAQALTGDMDWYLMAMVILCLNALFQHAKRRLTA